MSQPMEHRLIASKADVWTLAAERWRRAAAFPGGTVRVPAQSARVRLVNTVLKLVRSCDRLDASGNELERALETAVREYELATASVRGLPVR